MLLIIYREIEEEINLTNFDIVYKILKDHGKPLHYLEITKIVTEKNLFSNPSKTPERSISATITNSIKKCEEKNVQQIFKREDKKISLVEWNEHNDVYFKTSLNIWKRGDRNGENI